MKSLFRGLLQAGFQSHTADGRRHDRFLRLLKRDPNGDTGKHVPELIEKLRKLP